MTIRDNRLRAARFEGPESIPMYFHINAACWHYYPQDALQELMSTHPLLFPDFCPTGIITPDFALDARAGEPYLDPWGCRWETTDDGIVGAVVGHPLADWSAFTDYSPPHPGDCYDWPALAITMQNTRQQHGLLEGSLPHGHTFLRLCDLRGYENALMDMVDEEPRLDTLLEMIAAHNAEVVQGYLRYGVEWMGYPEDLGMQVGPMLSPSLFQRYIKPIYQRLMHPAREAGCVVHMHSDGDLHTLIDDLLDGGVTVINLQDLVNGIDWIAARLSGQVCIDLDIDRQLVTRYGTAAEIDDLIHREVAQLGCKEGGLMMIYGLYPGVPLVNVKALMDAMERYSGYFS